MWERGASGVLHGVPLVTRLEGIRSAAHAAQAVARPKFASSDMSNLGPRTNVCLKATRLLCGGRVDAAARVGWSGQCLGLRRNPPQARFGLRASCGRCRPPCVRRLRNMRRWLSEAALFLGIRLPRSRQFVGPWNRIGQAPFFGNAWGIRRKWNDPRGNDMQASSRWTSAVDLGVVPLRPTVHVQRLHSEAWSLVHGHRPVDAIAGVLQDDRVH